MCWLSACSLKPKQIRPDGSFDEWGYLSEKRSVLGACVGRVWFKVQFRDGTPTARFMAQAWISADGRFRLEAIDPLGVTHHLIRLDRANTMHWKDFDRERSEAYAKTWRGVPVSMLSSLFLGFAPQSLGVAKEQPTLSWADMGGSQRVLTGWRGVSPAGTVVATYSQFVEAHRRWTPRKISLVFEAISAPQASTVSQNWELELQWREQSCSEVVPDALFES